MRELDILFKELDILLNGLSESKITDNIISKIKDKITNFIKKHKSDILNFLPDILAYISASITNRTVKKELLGYIAGLLISTTGVSLASVKDVYVDKNITGINWGVFTKNDTVDCSKLKVNFKVGEYEITNNDVMNIYNNLKKQVDKNTISLAGEVTVSISDEHNEKVNFANDDTEKDKVRGGKLIQKRKKEVAILVKKLEDLFSNDGNKVKIDVDIVEDKDGRYIKFDNLVKKESTEFDATKKLSGEKNSEDSVEDKANISPLLSPRLKDITGLSRNYQFIEILKLGDVKAKRFENDNLVDEYSKWILNTRKSIKKFLNRLQKAYPEYDINFNKKAIAVNPVAGSTKGVSNISKQYINVKNESILSFEEFINENKFDKNNSVLNKWEYILGGLFPNLTFEQAVKFDQNIEIFLDYLEQIFGQSSLEFSYSK